MGKLSPSEAKETANKCETSALSIFKYQSANSASLTDAELGILDQKAKELLDNADKLNSAAVDIIIDSLEQPKNVLKESIARLEKAISSLKKVNDVISALTSLLSLLGNIVPLIG